MYMYAVFVFCAVVAADTGDDKDQSNEFVGFSVTMKEITSVTPGQMVKYNNVITNVGNHYDPDTGVFTAPRTGYYMFHIHAITNGPAAFWFQLVHNGIARVNCHGFNAWAMGGNSVLLHVMAGESVYVRAVHLTGNVYDHATEHYTTFCGVMVGQ
ncbi:hypothetical protein BsWGS_25968 [Bradybaena similaris]